MQRTVVVVPCYNEAARLQSDALVRAVDEHATLGFVLVDDGSKDETASLLEDLSAQRPGRFRVVRLPENRGKAEAVRQGMSTAFQQSPELLGYFDADLATPLSEIAPMAALFDNPETHMVMGSRVQLLGRKVVRSTLRHYLGRVYASTASLALGLEVYDTQCGAKLFRNAPAIRELFQTPFMVNWSFDVEIIARIQALSERDRLPVATRCIVEYPLREWRDVSGSKLGPRAAFVASLELGRLWKAYRTGQ